MRNSDKVIEAIQRWSADSRPDLIIWRQNFSDSGQLLDFPHPKGEHTGLIMVINNHQETPPEIPQGRKVVEPGTVYDSLQALTSYLYPDLHLSKIHQVVCYFTGGNPEAIFKEDRHRRDCMSRQVTIYLMWKIFHIKKQLIGYVLGKNHATVIHSIKTVKNGIETDKSFRKMIEDILRSLEAEEIHIP